MFARKRPKAARGMGAYQQVKFGNWAMFLHYIAEHDVEP